MPLPRAHGFFLPVPGGERYCLYHAPATGGTPRGAWLHVHAFAEEMNKSRRMAALQARAFAAAGHAVLQIDLHGCGDSSGDFSDARWETWHDDLERARQWLAQRHSMPPGVWGTRLGGLLALDFATHATTPVDDVLLWQPVLNGEQFMTQFLRIRMAADMMGQDEAIAPATPSGTGTGGIRPAADGKAPAATVTTQSLRAALSAGDSLEIGGYLLAPQLAGAIDRCRLAGLGRPGLRVHWFEVVSETGRGLPPAAATVAAALREKGVALQVHLAQGAPFWSSQEIVEAPELLGATLAITDGVAA